MTYIDQTPDKETKVSLIKTLETVTEGKVSAGRSRSWQHRRLRNGPFFRQPAFSPRADSTLSIPMLPA